METSNLIHGDFARSAEDSPIGQYLNETTRYLCGAAYTDAGFRNALLKRERDTVRARAPETGVDVALVTEHCHRAARSSMVRDVLITILAFVGVGLLASMAGSEVPDPSSMGIFAACCFGVFLLTVIETFRQDNVARRELIRDAFYRRQENAPPQDGDDNVVIYSGFSPFVGSGFDIGGWSFAIDLDRPAQTPGPQRSRTFQLSDLYNYVEGVFTGIHLPRLKIRRKLFASGKRIRDVKLLLKDAHRRPVTRVSDEIVSGSVDFVSGDIRHYLCLETTSWDGEVIVTFFVQFRRISSKLFVEVSTFLLPSIRASYFDLDKVHYVRRFKDTFGLIITSVVKSIFLPLIAPFLCWGRIAGAWEHSKEDRQLHKEIDEDLLFDYGARQSVREMATGNEWRSYFQKLDKEMLHKIIQKQLVDSLADFLDDHGVDTSEIKERTMHILNNGVFVSGGTINAQGLAVGSGAQANVGSTLRRAREKMSA